MTSKIIRKNKQDVCKKLAQIKSEYGDKAMMKFMRDGSLPARYLAGIGSEEEKVKPAEEPFPFEESNDTILSEFMSYFSGMRGRHRSYTISLFTGIEKEATEVCKVLFKCRDCPVKEDIEIWLENIKDIPIDNFWEEIIENEEYKKQLSYFLSDENTVQRAKKFYQDASSLIHTRMRILITMKDDAVTLEDFLKMKTCHIVKYFTGYERADGVWAYNYAFHQGFTMEELPYIVSEIDDMKEWVKDNMLNVGEVMYLPSKSMYEFFSKDKWVPHGHFNLTQEEREKVLELENRSEYIKAITAFWDNLDTCSEKHRMFARVYVMKGDPEELFRSVEKVSDVECILHEYNDWKVGQPRLIMKSDLTTSILRRLAGRSHIITQSDVDELAKEVSAGELSKYIRALENLYLKQQFVSKGKGALHAIYARKTLTEEEKEWQERNPQFKSDEMIMVLNHPVASRIMSEFYPA